MSQNGQIDPWKIYYKLSLAKLPATGSGRELTTGDLYNLATLLITHPHRTAKRLRDELDW